MKLELDPGKYAVAVSGGVDSMVLLDILAKQAKSSKPKAQSTDERSFQPSVSSLQLVVAHFNHGMRSDSKEDEKLVSVIAKKYGLPFEVGHGYLSKNTSEDQARKLRYKFLEKVKNKYSAKAIITAHHQDDLIETAFINILRGSGARGLTSISTNARVIRPLLHIAKKDILKYAYEHNIKWHEDSTNQDTDYLRNYLRLTVIPNLNYKKRRELLNNIEDTAEKSSEKDQIIATISHKILKNQKIIRSKYITLPTKVRQELIMYWLRQIGLLDYDRKTIERLDIALKTAKSGTKHEVKNGLWLKLDIKTGHFTSHV